MVYDSAMGSSPHVLVTGAAGYLGSTLVPRLLAAGCRVTALDDFRVSRTSLLGCAGDSRLDVIRGDVRDEATVRRALASADVVIPLAGIVGAPACDREPFDAVTINRDAIALLNRLRSPDQRVLFPTTNSGYGKTDGTTACDESTALNPVSLYGRSKVEAEALLLDAGNAVTFRLATVFGVSPRMRLDLLVNDFAWRAWRDRTLVLFEADYVRNFVAVEDVADLFAFAVEKGAALDDGPYNFGLSDANLSKRALCELVRGAFPGFTWTESATGTDPDQRNYVISNAKIERAGHKATRSVPAGLESLRRAFAMLDGATFGNA